MKPQTNGKNPQTRAILILFILLVAGSIIGLIVSFTSLAIIQNKIGDTQEVRLIWESFRTNFTIDTVIICMNLALLFGLLIGYQRDFRRTQAPFLLGLVLFLAVLFVQSLLSLPILNLILSLLSSGARQGFLYILMGYRSAIFGILAHFFETVALIILYHLSRE